MKTEKMTAIYVVKKLPNDSSIIYTKPGSVISVGDFGWQNAKISNSIVPLTGYNKNFSPVWYCDFKIDEVDYFSEKPLNIDNKDINEFPVKTSS